MRLTLTSALAILAALPALAQAPVPEAAENVPGNTPAFPEQTEAPQQLSGVTLATETITTEIDTPWGITVLPGEAGYLVTEQTGNLRHVARDGTVSAPIAGVPEVLFQRQGGLLDVEIAPDFAESRVIYLTYSKPMGSGMSATAAARAVLSEDLTTLTEVADIFVQTPPSPNAMHFGSRVVPSPDGATVYITTGEHFSERERVLSQDLGTTYGKVVRVTPTGDVPADNPFAGQDGAVGTIWTYGHRNVQGAALDPRGRLWTIEHGPAGGDELNLIVAGSNYGWPEVTYGINYDGSPVGTGEARHEPDFTEPRYYWDPVIAPGGMVFYDGEMFADWQGDVLASGLVAAAIVRLDIEGDMVVGEERLLEGIGRVRDVAVDNDGAILAVIDTPEGPVLRITPEG